MTGAVGAARVYRLDDHRRARRERKALRRLRLTALFVAAIALVVTWQFGQSMRQDRELERLTGRLGAVEQRTDYIQRQFGLELDLPV